MCNVRPSFLPFLFNISPFRPPVVYRIPSSPLLPPSNVSSSTSSPSPSRNLSSFPPPSCGHAGSEVTTNRTRPNVLPSSPLSFFITTFFNGVCSVPIRTYPTEVSSESFYCDGQLKVMFHFISYKENERWSNFVAVFLSTCCK